MWPTDYFGVNYDGSDYWGQAGVAPSAVYAFVDPDSGSLIIVAGDLGSAEVDPDAGSLVIV